MNKVSVTPLWPVDTRFVEDLKKAAQDVECVSLDIFDTAITRTVDSPVDVFAKVEKRLLLIYGKCATGFASFREQAEQQARSKKAALGLQDITLRMIYDELAFLMPDFEFIDGAMQQELEVETLVLVPVPEILAFVEHLSEIGKPYIFVSDMYLPAPFLERVLSSMGYEGWRSIYVSGDVNASKAKGNIWSIVKKKHPIDSMLHVGDDNWADGFCPTLLGIKTRLFKRAQSNRRLGANLTPDVLPFSYLSRMQKIARERYSTVKLNPWYELGSGLGALLVTAFINWLDEKVRTNKIKRLYFLARDGYLLYQAWKTANINPDVEVKYLYVSRRTLMPASGYLESSENLLSPHLIQFICGTDDNTTLQHILDRISLKNEMIEKELVSEYGSLDVVIRAHSKGRGPFESVMRRHADILYKNFKPQYEATLGYLTEQGLMDDVQTAIVDTGWNGTMQRAINTLLKPANREVCGFYYGLWQQTAVNRYSSGYMESALANPFEMVSDNPEVALAVGLLEELHGSPRQSTIGYKRIQDRWEPHTPEVRAEREQYDEKIEFFQRGTFEGVFSLFREGKYMTLDIQDCTIPAAKAALASVFLSPTEEELTLLGSLGHALMFDHSTFKSMLAPIPDTDEEAKALIEGNDWRPGLLKYWHSQASDREQRQRIRNLALTHLGPYMNERQLRQFWI
jgi:predicted HAD superfamily hydrolase